MSLNKFNKFNKNFKLDELRARLEATTKDRISVEYKRLMEWVEREIKPHLSPAANAQLDQWLDEGGSPPWTPLAAPIPVANIEAFVRATPNEMQNKDRLEFVADKPFEMVTFANLAAFMAKYPAASAVGDETLTD